MPMNSIPSNVRSHQREQGGDSVQVHIAKAVASDMDFDADGVGLLVPKRTHGILTNS